MAVKNKNTTRNVLYGVSNSLGVFPLALAMGVCSNLGIYAGIISAFFASLFSGFAGRRQLAPTYLVYLIYLLLSLEAGRGAASVALAAASVISFIAAFGTGEYLKRFTNSVFIAGILLAAAFCTTAMQTTFYFGIGASGESVLKMIGDYVSRGFHPNWRGVLYGTITLVIMITYPRKFKSFCIKLPASFAALTVTLVLNLFLNPDAATTAIDEAGYYSFLPSDILGGALYNGFSLGDIAGRGILLTFSVFAMAAVMSYSFVRYEEITTRRERVLPALCGLLCSLTGGLPVTYTGRESRGVSGGVTCAVLTLAMLAARPLVSRIPVATLAVILIVTAWQAVDWRGVGLAFKGGVFKFAALLLQMFSAVAAGIALTTVLTCAFSGISNKRGGKKHK
jgi:SulP family sulfate permease